MSSASPVTPTHGDHTPESERPPPAPIGASPAIGTRLASGRYEVMEKLGEGGMSVVLGAFDTELERPVAIKILLAQPPASRAIVDEARMTAAVPSPHVVAVHAVHLDEDPPFFVMERVYGISLEARLGASELDLADALQILRELGAGLDALHRTGLVHGDIKPSNVLLDRAGMVKIVDFGLAPLLARVASSDVLGTPSYMPPERGRGLVVTAEHRTRADVYSFAVVAYRLLARRAPFEHRGVHEMLRAHALETAPPPSTISDLSPAFDAPFARALAKNPADRTATAGALVRELERAATGCTATGRQLRVLVVDADDEFRSGVSSMLGAVLTGCEVLGAHDAPEALRVLDEFEPNVVVVDAIVPGRIGAAFVQELYARAPGVGVIVVTGRGSGTERAAAQALGVTQFLIKPVEPNDLARAIHEAVDRARAREAA